MEASNKEYIILDTAEYLSRWRHHQCDRLCGVMSSSEWLKEQCLGEYWLHIKKTLEVVHCGLNLHPWGLEVGLDDVDPTDPATAARCAQQNEMLYLV